MLLFENLVKTFGDTRALDGMSFKVSPGEVFGFVGPNGAGKTTAMRAVFGLVTLDSGIVTWNGQNIRMSDKKTFGYMPEERGLYPKMNVLDHLIYLGRLHGLSLIDARKRAGGLIDELNIHSGGSNKIESLSLGNQQRTQIAAALMHRPELLVLDEPFSGLDPLSVETVRNILISYARAGKTVLFSSHQLEVVEGLCETIAIANHGRIVLTDRVDHLTTSGSSLIIKVTEDPEGIFLQSIPGIDYNKANDGTLEINLDQRNKAEIVLNAALAAGTLERYQFARQRLSTIFKMAIASSDYDHANIKSASEIAETHH